MELALKGLGSGPRTCSAVVRICWHKFITERGMLPSGINDIKKRWKDGGQGLRVEDGLLSALSVSELCPCQVHYLVCRENLGGGVRKI